MTVHVDLLTARQLAASSVATISLLAPGSRYSLRVGETDRDALSQALDLALPEKIGECSRRHNTEILCLGPDEWIVLSPESDAGTIAQACAAVYDAAPHSLTDISDREVTVLIEGPKAAELMTLGCPRDLEKLPNGQGRRTVFDGVSVILWRDGPQRFRLDVWRSFASHVISLLATGCGELALE
ncbi:sarcosine oxidase subunit gamma [Notoacmeibacter sp. MSK16QG-6]|uniref:sarcosine oxidase subunit gamma n=1 Tax=Notoacmeibacter sp. MSK16QG-6 TaxID=2957982 RepID=UPI00209E3D83|nr:sarcosine oxidase subunit gamma [Notoacmeibacter sp. MSK16QG-6]MCP1200803.1 sarcosine oxidase subunit gamma [Notoacmeibacter sp. MSK16QG-6]